MASLHDELADPERGAVQGWLRQVAPMLQELSPDEAQSLLKGQTADSGFFPWLLHLDAAITTARQTVVAPAGEDARQAPACRLAECRCSSLQG